jgi:hypothetical protein
LAPYFYNRPPPTTAYLILPPIYYRRTPVAVVIVLPTNTERRRIPNDADLKFPLIIRGRRSPNAAEFLLPSNLMPPASDCRHNPATANFLLRIIPAKVNFRHFNSQSRYTCNAAEIPFAPKFSCSRDRSAFVPLLPPISYCHRSPTATDLLLPPYSCLRTPPPSSLIQSHVYYFFLLFSLVFFMECAHLVLNNS